MGSVRRAAVLVFAAACGRIGFDGSASADAQGAEAGTSIALCDPHTVMPLTLDGTPTRVRAMVADIGYIVAIETSTGAIYIARVPSSLDTAEMHLPFTSGYSLGGVAHAGAGIFVNARTGGVSYLKLLDPTFDAYATIESIDDIPFDPPLAERTGGTAWRVARFAGFLEVAEMDAAGTKTGLVADYAPSGIAATISGNRVVYEIANRCETFLVDDAGVTSKLHLMPGCSDPRVAVLSNGRALIVHRVTPDQMQLYVVPEDPAAAGDKLTIGDLSETRIAANGTSAWVMARKAAINSVLLGKFDLQGGTSVVVPVTGPFDITPSAAFWVEGTALRVGTPCLR